MRRRTFLRSTMAAAATCGASSLGGTVEAGQDAKGSAAGARSGKGIAKVSDRIPGERFQLSLAAYSFRKELGGKKPTMTLEEFIDYCAGLGLHGTELTEYYFRRKDIPYIASLRRRATVNGLAVSGSPLGNNFCLPPGAKRAQQISHVKRWVDHASLLGAQTVRVFAGSVPKGGDEKQSIGWAIEGLKECAEHASTKGVVLALENHGGITARAEQLIELVERTGSPWLGVNLDTGNFHRRVYESLETAAPYAVSVQVKVETREGSNAPQPTDYRRIASILKRAGYRGYVALEYEAAESPRAAVPRHLDALREALGS